MPKPFTLAFAVCHPDDEALWTGGLLYEFSRFDFLNCYVVCLSGQDSPRTAEFAKAKIVAGYKNGVIVGGPLRAASTPLPDLGATLTAGLDDLRIPIEEIDLLVTHSPYGDEHTNPHHIQAHRELKKWAASKRIPFGCFSCIQIPTLRHRSILRDLRQHGTLRLLQLAHCTSRLGEARRRWERHAPAKYYLQFLTDSEAKARMTACYESIDVEKHDRAYTMFSNPCEALYLFDDRALKPFLALLTTMTAPGASPLVDDASIFARIYRRFRNLSSRTKKAS